MTRLMETWHVGQAVWAAQGTVGWRPAVITHVGYKWIHVLFNSGRKSYGKRTPENLRPRNRGLDGLDKPEPLKEIR